MSDTRTGTQHPVRRNRHDKRPRVDPDSPGVTIEKTFQSPNKMSCGCGGVLLPNRNGSYECMTCKRLVKTRPI